MGKLYLRERGAKTVSLRPLRDFRRDMSFLPVPITTLDGGETQESTSLATTLRHQFPHVLLIECMLERMCAIYETDLTKQKELYDALRTYFIRFRLLPPTAGFPEMNGVRLRISSDLNKLFCLAKHEITTNRQASTVAGPLVLANPSPLTGSVWSSVDGSEHLFTSRYELDFKEMEFIAAGGFGVVYKAHNILDKNEYAIKKIVIGPRSANKILREVHLLSQLHHPNIVAYKSAWLEYCPPKTLNDILQHMDDGLSISSQENKASELNLNSYSCSHECEVVVGVTKRIISSNNSDNSIVFESETPTNTSPKRCSQSRREMETSTRSVLLSSQWCFNRVVSAPVMLLYIQMQLCPQTLRQWLKNRNSRQNILDSIDVELSIFRQIVEGMNYIHNRNIIHRDIKPDNIFVNITANQVLIGDFGLAVLDFSRNDSTTNALSTPVRPHAASRGVGTHTYAAPEQLANQETDAKSDIYSLGIVFLEFLTPFKTDMERYKTIEKLRSHSELPEDLEHKWPHMASLILKMVSFDRFLRPTAAEIITLLNSDRTSTEKTTIPPTSKLSHDELLSIIEDLRRQVAEKDLIIEALTKKQ